MAKQVKELIEQDLSYSEQEEDSDGSDLHTDEELDHCSEDDMEVSVTKKEKS